MQLSPRAMSAVGIQAMPSCVKVMKHPGLPSRKGAGPSRRNGGCSWAAERRLSDGLGPQTLSASLVQGARLGPKSSLIEEDGSATSDICSMAVKGGYNAADNAAYWETRPVPVIARLVRIAAEFMRWQLLSSTVGKLVVSAAGSEARSSPAILLEALIRLGPAFVKIGQALSSRPDVLPPAFLDELEKLQDRIPAFPNKAAFVVIEEDLGRPVSKVFVRISPDPVAAASLGQVYRATLADGREVAVKVQRPGVVEMIAMDVFILRYLAAALRRWFKFNTDLPSLVDEWATSLFRELDYNREAANAARFKQLFARMPEVYVPEVYLPLTTTRVMTMEWVNGERLRTASSSGMQGGAGSGSPEDLRLVEVGVRCSLEQMLEEGFYHADPHPGNLLKMADGRLAYLDFGMMGSIDLPVRQALVRATLHLVNREYGPLADDIVALGFLPSGSDRTQIVPALTGVFQQALANGVGNLSFGDLSTQLGRTMYAFKFRVPAYYTLLVRSLTVLEGIALASDPKYKVLSAAYPWVARRLLTDNSPELHDTLRSLLYKSNDQFQFDRLVSLLEQAAKVKSLGQLRASSVTPGVPGTSPLKLLLSSEGAFIRGILLDEVAKGIDAAWRLSFDAAVESAQQGSQQVPSLPLLLPLNKDLALTDTNTAVTRQSYPKPFVSVPAFGGGLNAPSPSPLTLLLQSIPKLASAEDRQQVQGLTQLASALYSVASASEAAGANGVVGVTPRGNFAPMFSPSTAQVQQAAAFFEWLASELSSLPQEERKQALLIPLQLLDRVSSRLIARAIRNAINPGADA